MTLSKNDQQLVDTGVRAYQLGKEFAKRVRIGKRFFGSRRIGMRVYGLTYKLAAPLDYPFRYEFECFQIGYNSVLENKQVSVSIETGLVTGFSDRWGNKTC